MSIKMSTRVFIPGGSGMASGNGCRSCHFCGHLEQLWVYLELMVSLSGPSQQIHGRILLTTLMAGTVPHGEKYGLSDTILRPGLWPYTGFLLLGWAPIFLHNTSYTIAVLIAMSELKPRQRGKSVKALNHIFPALLVPSTSGSIESPRTALVSCNFPT